MPRYVARLSGYAIAQTTLEILAQSPKGATKIARDTVEKINDGVLCMDWDYWSTDNVTIDGIEPLEEADA